jgi:serine/threonine protein kinase
VHTNVKPENIFVNSNGNCKIIDFASSFRVEVIDGIDIYKITNATHEFLAPEVNPRHNQKAGYY